MNPFHLYINVETVILVNCVHAVQLSNILNYYPGNMELCITWKWCHQTRVKYIWIWKCL